MKYFLIFFLFLSVNILNGQKKIVCASGQIIDIDGANNLISTNADTIVKKFIGEKSEEIQLLKILLTNEEKNRLTFVANEKYIFLTKYDLKNASKTTKTPLQLKLSNYEKEQKLLDKSFKEIEKEVKAVMKLDKKSMPILLKKYNLIQDVPQGGISDSIGKTEVIVIDKISEEKIPMDTVKAPMIKEKKSESKATVKKSKKTLECQFDFNGRNAETKKKQIILKSDQVLTYTPAKMVDYFKTDNFLKISAALEENNGRNYINIEAKFNSKDVMKSYGTVHKTDFLRLEFISGNKIFLKAVKVEDPYLEKHSGNTIFKVQYIFESDADMDKLKSEYLDKLGIMWSSGFESYVVYDVDFFQRQFSCFKSAK